MPASRDSLLPPLAPTPAAWVAQVTADPLALLQDHAHLERKAATNALDLLGRWPNRVDLRGPAVADHADQWVRVLTGIARDELRHLGQVLRRLHARGGHLERTHENAYARALHARVRRGHGLAELLDRLCVSALIEARSCERFALLGVHAPEADLRRFYAGLCRSERGHFRAFLELARLLPVPEARRETRWRWWLAEEAAAIAAVPPGPTLHGGVFSGAAGVRSPETG